VEFDETFGSSATRPFRIETRVQTVFIDTGSVDGAVIINPTFRSVTLSVRVATISFRTCANRVVSSGRASCLWGAGVVNDAWINASFIDTCLVLWTFRVRGAFRAWLNGKAI